MKSYHYPDISKKTRRCLQFDAVERLTVLLAPEKRKLTSNLKQQPSAGRPTSDSPWRGFIVIEMGDQLKCFHVDRLGRHRQTGGWSGDLYLGAAPFMSFVRVIDDELNREDILRE